MKFNKSNRNFFKYLLTMTLFTGSMSLLFFQSCNNDDPVPENESELITTLTMTFTNVNDAGNVVVAQFRDVDGAGGNDPEITNPILKDGETYDAEIQLLNESISPADNITSEVEAEGEAHQFFFSSTDTGLLSFGYLDEDSNGNPIGLSSRWETLKTGTTSFRITLRHQPDKDGMGVSEGDISNAGGETDLEVTFELTVE